MARFYGEIQGNRGAATRMGTTASGIDGHLRGWDIGVQVDVQADRDTDEDVVTIIATGGSGSHATRQLIGSLRNIDGVIVFESSDFVRAACRKRKKVTA